MTAHPSMDAQLALVAGFTGAAIAILSLCVLGIVLVLFL
jgi:hypothetical protein